MSNRFVFPVAALAGLLLLCCAVGVARAATADGNTEETVIKSGELRVRLFATCAGCSLNRMPEVRAFVYHDAPKYQGLRIEFEQGIEPVIYWYDQNDRLADLDRLGGRTREQLNELVRRRGLKMREEKAADPSAAAPAPAKDEL